MNSLVSFFNCEKEQDIETFIKDKAIDFEKLGKSRTFIVFSNEDDTIKILGFFSLAIQTLEIPKELSNSKRKKLVGRSFRGRDGEIIASIPTILIGQLGKNDGIDEGGEIFSGEQLMQFCLAKILEGQKILSGRTILVECKPIEKLIEFYERFGFKLIKKDYADDELRQLVRILNADEII